MTPEPTPEVTPEPTPEVTPEPAVEPTPEPTPEVTPEPLLAPVVTPTDPPTDPPADETVTDPVVDPTDPPADEPTQLVLDDVSTPSAPDASNGPLPTQQVLGSVSGGGTIQLPETDTLAGSALTGTSTLEIFILAALAGAAVLVTPARRREEATAD